ncbi:MAG: energy transducer TonB [Candidatus Zixiibacteriota bacterium]
MTDVIYNSPQFSPYGAYELKARYQRNMLMALLAVIILVTLTVGVFMILFGSYEAGVERVVRRFSPTPLPPPRHIDREKVEINVGGSGRTAAPDIAGLIPVPKPDSEIIDINAVIPTRGELSDFLDNWNPGESPGIGGEEGNGGGAGLYIADTTDYLPGIMEFVPVETLPEMVYEVKPEYPRLAKQAGLEAELWMRVLVGKQGKVLDAVVHKSSGMTAFDEAALQAAYKNKFKPAIQNHVPFLCWVSYKVEFTLER